jgi:hypothetical protein
MSTISARLGLDTQGFTAGITKAEAQANSFAARLRNKGVGLFSGKSAQESAGSIAQILAAQEKLDAVRRASTLERATGAQRIAILETEIAAAAAQVAAIEGTTVQKLSLQLGIEEKRLQIDRLQAAAAANQVRLEAAAAAAAERAQSAEIGRLSRIAQLEAVSLSRRQARETAGLGGAAVLPLGPRSAAPTAAEPASRGSLLGTLGGVIGRTFGVGAIFKGLLVGAGIGTALQVVDKAWSAINARMERARLLAEEVAASHERIRTAVQRAADVGRTDPQRLAALAGRERVLARQLQFAEQDPSADPSRRLGLVADLAENRASQAELRPRVLAEQKRALEEILAVQREVAASRRERELSALPLEAQLERAKERQLAADRESGNLRNSALARARYSLVAEEAITEQARLRAEIQTEAQAAWDRALAEEEKRQAEVTALVEKEAAAKEKVAAAAARVQQAGAALATAQRDALRSTPQELARTASGRRDTTASGVAARGILRDEATARRLARSGGTEELFDFKARRTVQAGAEFFQRRALDARGGLDQLTSAEQNPFAGAEKELAAAGKELSAAAKELKTITLEIDAS